MHSAFVLTGISYFAVSCSGFWAFGTAVPENILDAIHDPNGAITAAHLAVVLHVLASYQVGGGVVGGVRRRGWLECERGISHRGHGGTIS